MPSSEDVRMLCVYIQQYRDDILFMRLLMSFHTFELQYIMFVKQDD